MRQPVAGLGLGSVRRVAAAVLLASAWAWGPAPQAWAQTGAAAPVVPIPPALAAPPTPSPGPPGAVPEVRRVPEEIIPGIGPPPDAGYPPPGLPPRNGRPRPGSVFDPGATGPGISQGGDENFLDGALDPRTGWPFVLYDHFRPRPERVERFWIVHTRGCPQVMGTDPWPTLKVLHFDDQGELVERDPRELLAQCAGRLVLVQVQGSLTTPDTALGGLLWTDSWLRGNRALRDGAVVVAFDWPSQRLYRLDARDINEKGRRAYVAGYHLARFLQAFPAESRVCLIGQSYGGRVVPSALHLLGGGALNSQDHDPPVRLPGMRPDLHVRAVVIAGASDHNWLNPGQRLDRALYGCEGLLNLYNRRDEALRLYPLLIRSGHRHALGKVGLSNRDLDRLGPLAARYAEFDVNDELGREHTLLDAVANPRIAREIAPYLWNPNPEAAPRQMNVEREGLEDRKANRRFGYGS
jgi:hypothetical protein